METSPTSAMARPADHPDAPVGRVAVLLVNLGTPDAPDAPSVKRYLREFLSDKRVVELPALLWQPILRGIVLNTRPKKSAHAYSLVWGEGGSPLAAITARQAKGLQARLGNGVTVDWAMRYGNPSIADRITALKEAGHDRILFAPLYPQYSAATTATAVDALGTALAAMRWQPAIRTLPPYHDAPAHIAALASDLTAQIGALPAVPEVLLLSFHGMPERTLHLGDPYHCHCRKTARLLAEALAPVFPAMRVDTTFQSRFGKAKWLEPATDTTIEAEAKAGTKSMAVAMPGFSADCLETLEEIALQGRDTFLAAGGESYTALTCLNDGEAGMTMLETLIRNELQGWI
ncbi:ferrochelatase [Croceicoccus bisphenolivorans]|uniref:ferrochelatase n=1 Tax=Croceicoccus bisphenolivorans TaxID=1783232 RepID=UPI000B292B7B|nr:ferrochelatase [Croceicoccus bisphenolivorans]